MDLPVTQTFRMVHRRSQRCWEKRCYRRAWNSYIHYAILPQVRFAYYYAGKIKQNNFNILIRYTICKNRKKKNFLLFLITRVLITFYFTYVVHMWESFSEAIEEEYIYRTQGHKSLRSAGHDILPEICSEETQLRASTILILKKYIY